MTMHAGSIPTSLYSELSAGKDGVSVGCLFFFFFFVLFLFLFFFFLLLLFFCFLFFRFVWTFTGFMITIRSSLWPHCHLCLDTQNTIARKETFHQREYYVYIQLIEQNCLQSLITLNKLKKMLLKYSIQILRKRRFGFIVFFFFFFFCFFVFVCLFVFLCQSFYYPPRSDRSLLRLTLW